MLVSKPILSDKAVLSINRSLMPSECRERGTSYTGRMNLKLCWTVNESNVKTETRQIGAMPIMVKSNRCHLEGKSPSELISLKEDQDELGGYFIVNGNEKLIRLLIVPRRNHPVALERNSFTKRGPRYSVYGVQIRSVRDDQTSQTICLHYLTDGKIMLRFSFRKNEYLVPLVLVLKSLIEVSDKQIFQDIVQDNPSNTFVSDRAELLLRDFKDLGLFTRQQCLDYIGSRFQILFDTDDNIEAAQKVLANIVLVHLESARDKYNMLVYMLRKLYSLVGKECCPDNPDSPMHQEVLLGGHLFLGFFKEKLDDYLSSIHKLVKSESKSPNFVLDTCIKKALTKVPSDIGKKLEYFLATGNLVTQTGMDLQQVSGYTIVAEKLNFLRYLAHFRSIHRGAFFAELKTTTVRKLLPEAWGFLCPVHTPDGSPCGLLNHLSHTCEIVTDTQISIEQIVPVLYEQGVLPITGKLKGFHLSVQLDGKVIGHIPPQNAKALIESLRRIKLNKGLPKELEIAHVPVSNGGLYPGVFLFTTCARMMRPVKHLETGETELIGTFEQVYMDIAVKPSEIFPVTTHLEIEPTNILSVIANLTPFCDFNQSPRNMYQCQMGKQSMGTPMHNFPYRTDNKIYRLNFGQSPIVKPKLFNEYGFDQYPNGCNAVVAVISYTGYDMEDAMILNKSSYERGFGHATVYKSEQIDISDRRQRGSPISHHFGSTQIDPDGLPKVGQLLKQGDPLYSVIDSVTGTERIQKYKSNEDAYVEEVRLIGDDTGSQELQRLHLKYRIPRNPIIGDKFSSRHGQKGVCSQKWPMVDMPFSESGMQPDVIINPHAFPSRMTIGMFIESMAGKSGALHGICQDATPFKFNEQQTAADFFGEQLKQAGYNYYGNEPMYSGITGKEMKADIYLGLVYYQRLRHMVSDKFQVRTTGPVHNLTQQPVKGRKRAGGIRFGEMERDSLLAHGVSFMLLDRLMNSSDYSQALVCIDCGTLCTMTVPSSSVNLKSFVCLECDKSKVDLVAIPYVFRYLCTELMAMNIRVKLEFNKDC